MDEVVTPRELALKLGVTQKSIRTRLRAMEADRDPLVADHQHGQRWEFKPAAAKELVAKLAAAGQGLPRPQSVAKPAAASRSLGDVTVTLRGTPPELSGDIDYRRLPALSALYAWWVRPGVVLDLVNPAEGPTTNAGLELLYIGIAGSLSERIRNHLGACTGKSTLRRALGAWLGEAQGWSTETRAGRRQHTPASERRLTDWMQRNLSVTWALHDAPGSIESDLIERLRPPLNYDHNRLHPNWTALAERRTRWRGRAD